MHSWNKKKNACVCVCLCLCVCLSVCLSACVGIICMAGRLAPCSGTCLTPFLYFFFLLQLSKGVPALLIYRAGKLVGNYPAVTKQIPAITPNDIAAFLKTWASPFLRVSSYVPKIVFHFSQPVYFVSKCVGDILSLSVFPSHFVFFRNSCMPDVEPRLDFEEE